MFQTGKRIGRASALLLAASMLLGTACRDGGDAKQASIVIARSETTTTALPGPTILSEDGTVITGWAPQGSGGSWGTGSGAGKAPGGGMAYPPSVDDVPGVGGSVAFPYLPAQPRNETPAGTGSGTHLGQTPQPGGGVTSSPTSPTGPTGPPPGTPDGAPYGPALPFAPEVPVPDGLVFILAIGSDARPGIDPRRGNADSLHLLAVDPATGSGTVLGFPRDAWVDIPGRGKNKINAALRLGGPQLQAETIRQLTGLPVHYTVLTAFEGFQRMVDELGGVNVNVTRKMDDVSSGARFDPGWHHMTGAEALAYSRNRKDAPNGDFSRSLQQGDVMLAGLAKLRAEVGDDAGLARWIDVLLRHADLDSPPWELRQLATLARTLDPGRLPNRVLPGRAGTANSQFVVFLGEEAARIFVDLRSDAVIDGD
ncbi:MAG TPA: LCP family protein [Acidimicrobiia bacterium]|nr:LCP family protein [Acidimicrobiia bacterium]